MKKLSRKRLKLSKIIITLILLAIIFLGGYFLLNKVLFKDRNNIKIKEDTIEEPKEQVYSLSLAMVGDNLIHSSIYLEANKNANYIGYDFKPMYTYIKEIISNYDLAYYNQETILGGSELGCSTYPAFNSPYEVGDAMIDAGFNLVSLATNHTLDRGETAIINSCNYWKNKEGVMTAGSYCSFEERNEVKIMEKNHISYSLLSYTYGTNGIPIPEGKEYLVNVWPTDEYGINDPNSDIAYQQYKEVVKTDIERIRDKVDVLMVAMHWGKEYTHTPTLYEIDMASYLASLGVNIVIGSHPHVIQPVTWIDNTLVIYSLGNFISAQEKDLDYAKLIGLMSSLNITKTVINDEVSIKIENIQNELLFTSYTNWSNFKVVPFSNSNIASYVSDYERLYNKYSKIISNLDSNMTVKGLSS